MSLKIVFMLAFLTVVFGQPILKKPSVEVSQETVQNIVKNSDELSEGIKEDDETLPSDDREEIDEVNDEIESVPLRYKRACRSIAFRTKSGKIVIIRRC